MMKIFKWVTKDTTIDFMKARKFTYTLSIVMVLASFISLAVKGLNYGIDFSGGILMELKSENKIDVEALRGQLGDVNLDEINLQSIGEEGNEVVLRAQAKNLNEKEQMAAVNKIKSVLGNSYEYRRVELVGPQVGGELKKAGLVASLIAVLAISLYIWFRFEWQFAVGALIGLFHDLIVT